MWRSNNFIPTKPTQMQMQSKMFFPQNMPTPQQQ